MCIAEPHNPNPRYICTATSCPEPLDIDYVIKTEPVDGECCPRLVRTACQLETRVFKVIERIQCCRFVSNLTEQRLERDGRLQEMTLVRAISVRNWPTDRSWNSCNLRLAQQRAPQYYQSIYTREAIDNINYKGWEYRHENTSTCCGSCQQTACITEDGALHPLGQTWKPDPCTQSLCVSRENGVTFCCQRGSVKF